jgi:hypothetical protein
MDNDASHNHPTAKSNGSRLRYMQKATLHRLGPYEPGTKSPCFQGLSELFRTPLQRTLVHLSSRDPQKPIEENVL